MARSTLSKRERIRSRYCASLRFSRDADDAGALGQGAVAEGLEQGGHQLAPGEVAGAAENNEVETHDGECNLVSPGGCGFALPVRAWPTDGFWISWGKAPMASCNCVTDAPRIRAAHHNWFHEPTGRLEAVHEGRGRYRRLSPARPIPTAGRHHQPVADPQGDAEAGVQAPGRRDAGAASQGAAGRADGPADRALRHRDPAADPGPRLHGNGRPPELRHASEHHPRRAPDRAVPGRRRAGGPRADQGRLHLGRHPGGGATAAARHQHQPHAAVLLLPGRGLRPAQGAADLALRRPHLRLVQEERRQQLGRGRELGCQRPGREIGAADLPVLQALRHQDRSDGCELPQHGADPGAGRLRPADHQPRADDAACRERRAGAARAGPGAGEGGSHGAGQLRRGGLPLGAERGRHGQRQAVRRHTHLRRRRGQAGKPAGRRPETYGDRPRPLRPGRGLAACCKIISPRKAALRRAQRLHPGPAPLAGASARRRRRSSPTCPRT